MCIRDSNYDGDAYTIRNIQIRSTAQCIGLFGFTVGADLKDIIMYSDQGNEVINDAAGTHWYAMGGLVGFAGAGKNGASFTNCSVSGYIIRDLRANTPGWGGGCVGGLVGATNMNITGCSAVTDIIINISYDIGYRNLRVGGIAGVCRATLDKCYAGGSIQAEEMRNNYNGTGRSTNIWVAGLVGGVILRDQGNLESSMGTTSNPLTVQSCYSYVKLPTTTNAKTHVVASFAIASNGEMLHSFSIRYNSNGIQYTIPNPHAIIRNCYCLTSAVANTNDYTSFRNLSDADWKAGKNINMKDTSDVRRVVLTNDRSPYISYQDMAEPDKLAAWLNNGVSASPLTFDFVTVEENGVRIDGKYSFPGADAGRLDGLNYPFPTILTQLDAFGHKAILSGTSRYLSDLIHDKLNCKSRAIEFSTLQRCASHLASRTDVSEAYAVGGAAAAAAFAGETGKMIALKRVSEYPYQCITEAVDVQQVANLEKKVPLDWITPDGMQVTAAFEEYARPLILDEVTPVYVNGTPRHICL